MRSRLLSALPVVLFAAAAATCSRGSESSAGIIRVDGSSTVFPISEAVAEEFQRANPGRRVTVGISGTGGGFQKFCRGETDVSNASRPIKPVEIEACRAAGVTFTELPVAYDGIVVAVNPGNTWAESITVEELRRIWAPDSQGKITRWSQVRAGWPDRELHLFGPGVDSGTYDYFTEAIVGEEGASRGDFTSSEDDNVLVQGIANDELALGFFGIAYYQENADKLKALTVDDGDPGNGEGPVVPSVENVKNGTYQPLSRPLFIYVGLRASERPEVASFVEYHFREGAALAQEVGYVPLNDEGYRLAQQHYADRVPGSVFEGGGSQVGVTIEELLARER
ncbi:MAG TPA: PstS family phosphate ABC transporter substrate-binding protein [Methylomirabilota bacterium]